MPTTADEMYYHQFNIKWAPLIASVSLSHIVLTLDPGTTLITSWGIYSGQVQVCMSFEFLATAVELKRERVQLDTGKLGHSETSGALHPIIK